MFAHYNTINTVKSALLDHCAQTANLQMDSIGRSLQFYSTTAAHTLKALSTYDASNGIQTMGYLLKAFHQEQLPRV